MFLEKLEIQGFKSFAGKTTLVFPGYLHKDRRDGSLGLTAIVGPNGSGKSNIADAIRWVMGEQSMKTLRGKKSEDIIFGGSEKMGKLGMAEVSLHLNNEDKKAPIEYSQVIIARRIYRDGNSEYTINGNRVRLADIEMLLAKSNFGQSTYSVIGQGMVEGFLNTSLTERKEFFDEATGVKQFQIKRDESLNKLKLSLENLSQAQMLLVEIEPRLKSLTRQVSKLQKKGEIERELKEIQLNYYSKLWHEVKDKFNQTNAKFLEIEKIKMEREKKMSGLAKELNNLEMQNTVNAEFIGWQKQLAELQNKKDGLTREMAKIDAQLEVGLEASGNFDLAWLLNRKGEIERDLKNIGEEIINLEENINNAKKQFDQLVGEKNEINLKINELNNSLIKSSGNLTDDEIKNINKKLKDLLLRLETADSEEDIEKIKTLIKEVRIDLEKVLEVADKFGRRENMEKIQYNLIELARAREENSSLFSENNIKLSSLNERKKLLSEKKNLVLSELNDLEVKLKKYEKKLASDGLLKEKDRLTIELKKIESEMDEVREKINAYSEKEKEKRSYIFELQKKISLLQSELNGLIANLNELQVNAARYETRLEDMEAEIRNELGGLGEVEKTTVTGPVDNELALNKIHSLKKQLEMIGSLDPEIEKEYIDTKERFEFLDNQVRDLTETIKSLEKVIKELDLTIKEKFDKEFKIISQKFEEYFKILFNGGVAKVIKVTTDELLSEDEKAIEAKDVSKIVDHNNAQELTPEDRARAMNEAVYKKIRLLQKYNATGLAGIEVQATPPGKKIKSISLLSGGERALTTIALICAIISANPAPFVVLDEVDAALDEANSERLAKILDDLRDKTQFIAITHNRASMRRADILYGVTMQDDGVSKLLSVKLEDVKARNER